MEIDKPNPSGVKPSDNTWCEQPPQFSLRALFYWTLVAAIICIPCGLFGFNPFSFLVTLLLLGPIGVPALWIAGKINLAESAFIFGTWLLALFLILPAMTPMRSPYSRSNRALQCSNNLKQISLALRNYHTHHGTFPPAYLADDSGKPMHSWRVLILPFLEQQQLYAQYDFSQPWDAPANAALGPAMPDVFRCPADSSRSPYTSYLAVVGDKAAWPPAEGRTRKQITDGPAKTLHVVEVQGGDVHWMEPRDLDFASAAASMQPGPHQRYHYSKTRGSNVSMIDGSVHFLPDDTDARTIEALLTVDGGEPVNPDAF